MIIRWKFRCAGLHLYQHKLNLISLWLIRKYVRAVVLRSCLLWIKIKYYCSHFLCRSRNLHFRHPFESHTERSIGLEGMSEMQARRSWRFNCLLPAFTAVKVQTLDQTRLWLFLWWCVFLFCFCFCLWD